MPDTVAARVIAIQILQRCSGADSFSSKLLAEAAHNPAIDKGDLALIERIVRGALENQSRLDGMLNERLPRGLASLPRIVQATLRAGAYQVRFFDRTPLPLIVSETVEASKRIVKNSSHVSLINAVLRKLAAAQPETKPTLPAESAESLAEETSHPLEMVQRWVNDFGYEDVAAFCRFNNLPSPLTIRVNRLRTTAQELSDRLSLEGCTVKPSLYPELLIVQSQPKDVRLHELKSFRDGLFTIQDPASCLIGHLMDPQPGETIFDLCAAPGGKATHLAELMHDQGVVIALDQSPKRLELVKQNAERLGITSIQCLSGDAGAFTWHQSADRILLDAPCSGHGVLGRKSDIRWRGRSSELPRLAEIQHSLLTHAAILLKPGGRLVYSTCSIERRENEEVVARFLSEHSSFAVAAAAGEIEEQFLTPEGFFRSWPRHSGCAGGFAAALIRSAGGSPAE